MVLCVASEPSTTLSYGSLKVDEQNRTQHAVSIPKAERFLNLGRNGDVLTMRPEAVDEEVRKGMPQRYQVNTSTRTCFGERIYEKSNPINDFVNDPRRHMSAPRAEGHLSMDQLASSDTRVRKASPPYSRPLGPDAYNADPLGEKATGTLLIQPGEVHHAICLARDPTRESVAFKSPERGRTAPDVADERARPPVVGRLTAPDFKSWTAKGLATSKGERKIEADRWGATPRDPKPAAKNRCKGDYSPTVLNDGRPATTGGYASSSNSSPAYRASFESGRPRLVALPLGTHADTRLQHTHNDYAYVTAADPGVGPGSYNVEMPRFRSKNAAYSFTEPYYSLASGVPPSWVGLSLTASAPTTPAGSRGASALPAAPWDATTPRSRHGSPLRGAAAGAGGDGPASPSRPATQATGGGGALPLGVRVAAAREHISHNFNAPMSAPASPLSSPSALVAEQTLALRRAMRAAHGVGAEEGDAMSSPRSAASSPDRLRPATAASSTSASTSPARARTAAGPAPPATASPTSLARAMMAQSRQAQFGKLMFSTRHTAHRTLIASRLRVVQDVRRERAAVRTVAQYE